MKHEEEIEDILYKAVWRYHSGIDVCKDCGVEGWRSIPHDEDCVYGELLSIVNKHDNLMDIIDVIGNLPDKNSPLFDFDMETIQDKIKALGE